MARAYIRWIMVVETNDVYHEIGKLICNSLEEIRNVRYTEPKASHEDIEKLWKESGFHKVGDGKPEYWVKDTIDAGDEFPHEH
jgi:hypothetical protein